MSDVRAEIYNTYKKDIFSYFYRATLNYHSAEDLTGDTFLRAFKFFASFRGESSVKTWMFKIARNVLNDYLSKRTGNSEEIDESTLVDNSDDYNTLEKRLLIRKVLDKLSEEERTLITLRDANGLSYLEISMIMNYTEGQVKIGLHRARKKFKEHYLIELEV